MKIRLGALLLLLLSANFALSQSRTLWQTQNVDRTKQVKASKRDLPKTHTFTLNIDGLKQLLNEAPQRNAMYNVNSGLILEFPNDQGKFEAFKIAEAPVLNPELQERYPEIRSYVGQGIDDPTAIIRFSVSPLGFQSMRLSATMPTTFIEAYTQDLTQYTVFKRADKLSYTGDFECTVTETLNQTMDTGSGAVAYRNADDAILRTYRLVVSTTGEYAQYHGGTVALTLAAINQTMTRVNGLFETDFNVTMTLIGNTDSVIYTNPSNDPYGNTTANYNSELQSTLTNVIGEANYDIGHLFANLQNNGNAGCIGCVCVNGQKGSGWTSLTIPEGDPFDVDYVAHEMGHQFGGNHTFTFSNEGTGAQMEPGSGSTIMGYAGITGATDVQQNSDPYFHAASIQQITNYIKTTSCQIDTNTGNSVPTVNAGSNYTIPRGTPFVLDGTASDADPGDFLTYCWEQFDVGSPATTNPSVNNTSGAAFRSFNPTVDSKRYFPRLQTIKAGATSWQWEAVPNVTRNLNFRLTVRDNRAGGATNNSDDMTVSVTANAGPFVLNTPNTNVTWNAGTLQSVTWNVAGTTGNGVNAANVDIFLSTDGGDTYTVALATGVPNDGSHDIVVPNNQGNQNRVMVRGSNNIFFDISNTNFTIGPPVVCNATVPTGLAASNITDSEATLTWDAVPGATYDLRYREVGAPSWTTIAVTGISTTVSGLSSLTDYEAQVRSKCTGGSNSSYSASVNFTTTDVQLIYCGSQSSNTNDEYISRVQLNTIDNSSGPQFYSDFTNISTTLTKGTQYTITITPTWTGTVYAEGYSVWIDYNRDGDFTDAGEQVFTQAPSTATPVSGNFTVPGSAVENATRMRVTLSYNANVGPCDSFTYGEVEDYTINIQGSGPDTTPPVITLNGASPLDISQGDTYTELGATATDNVDGDISANIVIGGDTVDTNTLGTYIVTYNVSDAAGNAATEVTRTVNVNEPSSGCSGGISSFPYTEGFEGSIGGWTQSTADDLNWSVNSGGTPSNNTGPSSAVQGSSYIYVEASGNGTGFPNKRAIITSPCFNLNSVSSASFDFAYHQFGAADMGTIDLEISDDEGATWTSIWSQSGNQGNQWNTQSVSLNAYVGKGVQLRFNRVTGGTWQADIAIDDIGLTASAPDVTPPVITLNGPATLDLNVGDTYTEQGATATDNVDGDITGSIVIGGDTVNTSIAGVYVVTYNVSDAAGNAAAEVTRTVTVIADTTPPVITLIGASTINLNQGETYTEQGATATDNIDGDLTSSIVIGGDVVTTTIPGVYVVTYDVSDAAGNAATQVTRTVNVIADTTPPVITLIGPATLDLNVGDTYTEQGATATDNIDGDLTSAIVIAGDVVNTSIAGIYVVTYNVSDAAGNAATQVTRTVTVIADTTAPVITLIGASTINLELGDPFTDPGATASDNIDGDLTSSIVVGGDPVNTNIVGSYVITYNVSDAAGNAATQVTRTVNVNPDATPPVITLIGLSVIDLNVGETYFEQGATATDNIDGDISANIVITGTVNTLVAGTYFVNYNVSDSAGNAAAQVTRTVNVLADTTPPVITLIGPATLDLNVGDTYAEQGATALDNLDGDITGSIVIGGDTVNTSLAGVYVVTYNVSDAAGNAATQVTRTVTVIADTTPPVITLVGASTINLNVGDTYTEQGATATDNLDGDITASIVIGGDTVNTSLAGVYVVTYNVSDAAGNAATEVTRTVTVIADTTPPVITLIGASTINLNVGDSYTEQGATATDNIDGDLTSSIVIGGSVNTNIAGSYQVTYDVSDAAGNAASQVIRTVNVIEPSTGCSGGISTFPYSEGFESNFGGWTQSAADDLDWLRDASGTPSNGTGPSSAVEGSTYIYVEASVQGTGYPDKRAILTSPCFDLVGISTPTFSFQYHMFGAADMGSIAVEISDDDGASWTTLWSQTGNQGNQWLKVNLDLSAYIGSSVQLRFNRFVGSTWQADIAIDNINLTDGVIVVPGCSGGITSYPYSEGFENTLGGWTQSTNDDINWTVDANGTPSNGTGPSAAIQGSFYIYVEASGNGTGYPNRQAIINSPCFDLTNETSANFSFNYHQFGAANMGTIDLEASNDNGTTWVSIWNSSGNLGNSWQSANIDLSSYVGGSVQLRFNRITGNTWQADIAIDNINLTTGTSRSVVSEEAEIEEVKDIILYPNPVRGNTLHVKSPFSNVSYEIYNSVGQLVGRGVVKNDQIDISRLDSAVYQVQFKFEEGTIMKRFMKQ